jgi:hypothetical protein
MNVVTPFCPPHILAVHNRVVDPRQRHPVPPPEDFIFGQKGNFFKDELMHVADMCSITTANREEWYKIICKQVCILRE